MIFLLLFLLSIALGHSSSQARNRTFTNHGTLSFSKDVTVFWRIRPERLNEDGHFDKEFGTLEMTVKQGSRSWNISIPTMKRSAPEWLELGVGGKRVLSVPWVVQRFRAEGSVLIFLPSKSAGPRFLVGPQLEMNLDPEIYGQINGRKHKVALLINAKAKADGLLFEGEYHGSSQREYIRCSRVDKARIVPVKVTKCLSAR